MRQFSATKKTTGNKKKAKTGATAKRKTKTKEERKIPYIQLEKRHDESSEYEGKPLIQAEQPYAYKYKYSLS